MRPSTLRFLKFLTLLTALHLLVSIFLPWELGEIWMPLFWLPGARRHVPVMALALGSSVVAGLLLSSPVWLLTEWIRAQKADSRRRRGLCPRCAYDVRATPGRCPECGLTFEPRDGAG